MRPPKYSDSCASWGPGWKGARWAVVGDYAVLSIGSAHELEQQVIDNLRQGRKGLAAHPGIELGNRFSPQRRMELHVSMSRLTALNKFGPSPPELGPDDEATFCTLAVEASRRYIGFEIFAPTPQIQAALSAFMPPGVGAR